MRVWTMERSNLPAFKFIVIKGKFSQQIVSFSIVEGMIIIYKQASTGFTLEMNRKCTN